jgi:hypothetical protein
MLQANKQSAPLAQDTEHSSEAKLDLQVVTACARGRRDHALAECKYFYTDLTKYRDPKRLDRWDCQHIISLRFATKAPTT